MPSDKVKVVLDREKADALEEILDEKSWSLHQARQPGAKPGPTENLVNPTLDRVVSAVPPKHRLTPRDEPPQKSWHGGHPMTKPGQDDEGKRPRRA
jgi:hypothetical protein